MHESTPKIIRVFVVKTTIPTASRLYQISKKMATNTRI